MLLEVGNLFFREAKNLSSRERESIIFRIKEYGIRKVTVHFCIGVHFCSYKHAIALFRRFSAVVSFRATTTPKLTLRSKACLSVFRCFRLSLPA